MEYSFDKKGSGNGDHSIVEEYLDFTNEGVEEVLELGYGGDDVAEEGNISCDTSTVSTVVDSCNSFSGGDARRCFAGAGLSDDLYEPQLDDLAELEWQLANLVEEESFSNEDLQKLQIISPSGIKSNTLSTITDPVIKTETISTAIETEPITIPSPSSSFSNRHAATKSYPDVPAPLTCKAARSKRSRSSGPTSWSSAQILSLDSAGPTDSNSANSVLVKKPVKQPKIMDTPVFALGPPSAGRRCLHCDTDKTPQWRTGPMGPKTLCNACGVRYKSGRLVPEYRPAASPTFVVSKHSNSHRKVLELRRQKEMHMHHLHHNQLLMHGSSPMHAQNADDYLIHHPIGANFRQLI